MHKKKHIFIVYPYFSPAQKAGGIVSSLVNMVDNLIDYQFYIYTTPYDLDRSQHTTNTNEWISFNHYTKVFYDDGNSQESFLTLFSEIKPDTVYINGLYGTKYFLKPLLTLRRYTNNTRIVIAPRGMLHDGALNVKSLKKKIYFSFLKQFGVIKNIYWHATDKQEVTDIYKMFGDQNIILAKDTPPQAPEYKHKTSHIKKSGKLRAVFLSLITEKKNLLFLLKLLDSYPKLNIKLDIYGPIKDIEYWEICLPLIKKNKTRIIYKGEIPTNQVLNTFNSYDFFLLPTLGENFGHVIFESMVAGTPVFTTYFTPWTNLESQDAGINLPLRNIEWINAIHKAIIMDNTEYHHLSTCAQSYIKKYLKDNNITKDYKTLFEK